MPSAVLIFEIVCHAELLDGLLYVLIVRKKLWNASGDSVFRGCRLFVVSPYLSAIQVKAS